MFDLYLYSINLTSGAEAPDLPGVFAILPPKRAARGREHDLLFGLLSLAGGATLLPDDRQELMNQFSAVYYATGGPATSAMRAAAERLNNLLMERNLKDPRSIPLVGLLNFGVLRSDVVFLAHAGPVHTFLLAKDSVEEYFDADSTGRGLGQTRGFGLRFFQTEVSGGDMLLMSANPPASWTESSLSGSPSLSLEGLRRRLLNQAGPDLQALVAQVQKGNGVVHRLKPRTAASEPAPAASAEPSPAPRPSAAQPAPAVPLPLSGAPAEPAKTDETPIPPAAARPEPAPAEPAPAPLRPQPAAVEPPVFQPEPAPQPRPSGGVTLGGQRLPTQSQPEWKPAASAEPDASLPRTDASRAWKRRAARAWKTGHSAGSKVSTGARVLANRMLPGQEEGPFTLSPGWMLFMAMLIPVLVVAAATTVYFRSGRTQQHAVLLAQAQQAYDAAAAQKSSASRRTGLQQAQTWLQKAEEFGSTNQSRALGREIQDALDKIDGIQRIDFQLATPMNWPTSVRITRMVATTGDVYLLDGESGKVLRLQETERGYEFDPNFDCGPGVTGDKVIVSKLVDMIAAPLGNKYNAAILAIDGAGVLRYCAPDEMPVTKVLETPDTGWGKLTAITLTQETLLVLDPVNNAVWRYPSDTGLVFNLKPTLYFDEQVPDTGDALDIAAYGDELYILHANGQMTDCTYSYIKVMKLTTCKDPAPYGDERAGQKTSEPLSFGGTHFIQMRVTDPPDPSLFILDNKSAAIYHFSLLRNLQRVLHPRIDTESGLAMEKATALAISPDQLVFAAFGAQVYYARLP